MNYFFDTLNQVIEAIFSWIKEIITAFPGIFKISGWTILGIALLIIGKIIWKKIKKR